MFLADNRITSETGDKWASGRTSLTLGFPVPADDYSCGTQCRPQDPLMKQMMNLLSQQVAMGIFQGAI